jgi:hypothetical protein
MNVKLRNRRAVEVGLRKFLGNVVLPPSMISTICESEVNDAYLEYVIILNSKLHYAQDDEAPPDGSSLGLAPAETVAGQEVFPELEKLRVRAVTKVGSWRLASSSKSGPPFPSCSRFTPTLSLPMSNLLVRSGARVHAA